MSRLFRTKSFLTFRQLQSVFTLKLLFDMIRTQSKNILPVYSVLQNYFIYSRVKAFEILHGATTPVTSMKNRIEVISIHLIRKTFPVFQVIFTLVIKTITRKTMLTSPIHNKYFTWLLNNSLTYNICHWVDIYNQSHNILRLFDVLPNFPLATSEAIGNYYTSCHTSCWAP